jgi:LysR family nitrogen assimilation transcriptional regulator
VSLKQLAKLPLILPSQPNVTRSVLDREFAAANIVPDVAAEADVLSSMMSAVRTGVGHAIIPKGDLTDIGGGDMLRPLLIEPPLYLTASIISSGDFPLTRAGEAVRNVLAQFVNQYLRRAQPPGVEWISGERAISAANTPISK